MEVPQLNPTVHYPQLERVITVIERLRDPNGGCPWDLKQTHQSLTKFLIEESYEYLDAVERQIPADMCEELGDVLLQIILNATVAKQDNQFTIEDVAKVLSEKLIRRHPHVFTEKRELTPDEVLVNWKKIKLNEKPMESEGKRPPLFDPKILNTPALQTAHKIGELSHTIDFDWQTSGEVMEKVREELAELETELQRPAEQRDLAAIEEEMGDLLFTLVQLSRHLKIQSEATLRNANRKFLKRFAMMEELVDAQQQKSIRDLTRAEKEAYWEQAKKATATPKAHV